MSLSLNEHETSLIEPPCVRCWHEKRAAFEVRVVVVQPCSVALVEVASREIDAIDYRAALASHAMIASTSLLALSEVAGAENDFSVSGDAGCSIVAGGETAIITGTAFRGVVADRAARCDRRRIRASGLHARGSAR